MSRKKMQVLIFYPDGKGENIPTEWANMSLGGRSCYNLTDNFNVGELQRQFFPAKIDATDCQYMLGSVVTDYSRKKSAISMRLTYWSDDPFYARAKAKELARVLSYCEMNHEPVYLSIEEDGAPSFAPWQPAGPAYFKAWPVGGQIDRYVNSASFELVFELADPTLWGYAAPIHLIANPGAGTSTPTYGTAPMPMRAEIKYSIPDEVGLCKMALFVYSSQRPSDTLYQTFDLEPTGGEEVTMVIDSESRTFSIDGYVMPLPMKNYWPFADGRTPGGLSIEKLRPREGWDLSAVIRFPRREVV